MRRYLFACALALAAAWAHAGVGVTEIAGAAGDLPVTVFHPTDAPDQAVRRGPFALKLAPGAAPVRGNGRLVVLSHGSGGGPWVHSDLARALVAAGFTVAVPEHRGDSWRGTSDRGPQSWKRRPGEVSRAIDALARDARFAPLLSLDKVGVYGMSAGGHTALSMAGGRWSPGNFRRHCEANIADDFHTCVGLATSLKGNALDGVKKAVALGAIRVLFSDDAWQAHHDPRIAAVVAGVPVAADFDTASLAQPRVPLGLVTVGRDLWLVPRFHGERILAACASCERVAHLPEAGHGALLSPPPPAAGLNPLETALLGDAPGFDRAQMAGVDARIAGFMARHLLP